MSKRAISLGPPPGQPPAPRLSIRRAPGQAGSVGVVVDNWILTDARLLGVYTHWISTHTFPCFGSADDCPECKVGNDPIWKGYSVAYAANRPIWAVVEVTQEAIWSCPSLWKPEIDLRGARLQLWRSGKATNAPVRAALDLNHVLHPPASPVDCLESLIRLWFSKHRPITDRQVAALRAATLTAPPASSAEEEKGDAP